MSLKPEYNKQEFKHFKEDWNLPYDRVACNSEIELYLYNFNGKE